MKLPFFKGKPESEEEPERVLHFGLRIAMGWVQAVIWEEKSVGLPSILARSQYWEWDVKSEDSLLKQIDQALGECSAQVDVEVNDDVLLGVPGDWVHQGQLLPDARALLKKIMASLGLRPMGFVVTSEAVVNYLNQQGEGRVSGLLVGISHDRVELSLVVNGEVQSVVEQEKGEDLVADVIAGLQKFDQGHLPPKLLLFNGNTDLSELQHALIHYDWQSVEVGFLHMPEVSVIPADVPVESVIFSVTETEQEEPVVDEEPDEEVNTELVNVPPIVDDLTEESWEPDEELPAKSPDKELLAVGFVRDQDIREVGDDWLQTEQSPEVTEPVEQEDPEIEPIPEEIDEDEIEIEKPVKPDTVVVKEKSRRLPKTRFKVRVPWKVLFGLILIVGLLAGGTWWMFSRVTATLTLYLKPQLLEKEFLVTVDPEAEQSRPEEEVLKGEVLSVEVEGSESTAATGKSLIGDKAQGEVTIFNDTDTPRTLEAGTRLTASGDLVFTLDSEVTIASKSVDLNNDQPFSPGQATVAVTASAIGTEYNLKAQSAFRVANFSQSILLARNTAEFTGGTSREIDAVSKTDQTNVAEALETSLDNKALDELRKKLSSGQALIESSMTEEWVDQEYSHKVGEEAEQVSITGSKSYSVVTYSVKEFQELAKERLATDVPAQKQMATEITTDFRLVEDSEDEGYVFSVVTKSQLLQELNQDNIKEKIAGKTPESVRGYLTSLPSVADIEETLSPKLHGFLYRYPFEVERIEVVVEAQR